MSRHRVIVWGTGHLGKGGLRMMLQHPDLELVGVHGMSPEKLGRDAGDVVGAGKTGVIVTDDLQQLLALEADCLLYFASSAFRDAAATADIVPFLAAGTNVSTISHFHLQYPAHGKAEYVAPVEAACRDRAIVRAADRRGTGLRIRPAPVRRAIDRRSRRSDRADRAGPMCAATRAPIRCACTASTRTLISSRR